MPKVIIGNMCVLEEYRVISKEEGEQFSRINGFHFYESSNKLNINIKEPIYDLVEQIFERRNYLDSLEKDYMIFNEKDLEYFSIKVKNEKKIKLKGKKKREKKYVENH